ncbi:MAG: M43 family zinc metalloprotease [Bacteroidota bacterium]|nr:M43 family zinc metalloprotease [Bacteroidota bacterium]MDP3145869.1 M43 family zinc metalloprotease [Bacteroidota bacterium]
MKNILLYSLLIIGFITKAQNGFKCGQIEAYDYLFSQDKTAKSRVETLIKNANEQSLNSSQLKTVASTYTIPVVFHILHLGGSENISDAQINNAMVILNRDFAKKNPDTTSIISLYKPIAADCQIEFKLATLDENGNCTNGITRHYTQKTDWTTSFSNYIYTWDPSKYLNFYVVRTLQNGAAGYTYLPGSVGAVADAIVVLHSYVGSIGTSNGFSSRTLTHETGHWFNLQHVWGSTNQPGVACGDDGVGDTPITKGHNSCNLNSAVCTNGVVENVQNYMEYAYCSRMFTQGQKTRMHNCIISGVAGRNNLSSNSNLIATGVINPVTGCAPTAEFIFNPVTCIGNNFSFTDYSFNGQATNWLWSSPFAMNTSTLQNGVLSFTNSGITSVKLKVGNAFGEDSVVKQNLIVLAGTNSGTLNLIQGFETGVFPDNNWIASIPQYGGSFITNTVTAATGTNCVWVNNFYDNPNGAVSIYSPMYNFQNIINAPQLTFKYAYTQQVATNNDALKVFASINCGTTWTQLYSKSGTQLNTTGTLSSTPYLMPQPNEWVTETVGLSSFIGNQNLVLKFEFTPFVSAPGNNIFIDDINISGTVGVKENTSFLNSISVYPNPSSEILNVEFEMLDDKNVKIQLLNALGQVLINDTPVIQHSAFNIQHLTSGIYFLKLSSDKGTKVIKVIKE